jgi:hypothetical protein
VNTNETVTDSVADKKIAPGTSGSGEIVLENKSEVAAEIVASFVETGKPTNMTFTYTYENSNGTTGTVAAGTPIAIGINETVTITVAWVWTFTDTNETDYAGDDIKVDASFTVSQVD